MIYAAQRPCRWVTARWNRAHPSPRQFRREHMRFWYLASFRKVHGRPAGSGRRQAWVMESREDPARLPMSAIHETNPSRVSCCGPHSVQIAPIVCVNASGRVALVIARWPMNYRLLTDCSTNSICTICRQSAVSYRPSRSNKPLSKLASRWKHCARSRGEKSRNGLMREVRAA